MKKNKKAANVITTLADKSIPEHHRKQLLMQLCLNDTHESHDALNSVFTALRNNNCADLYAKKTDKLSELMEELQKGPLRYATFVSLQNGITPCRARVAIHDGTLASTVVPDAGLASSLRCGETVLIDGNGGVLLFRDRIGSETGKEAKLERWIGEDRVEVTIRDVEREVYLASADLIDKLKAGDVRPGSTLVVCDRRGIAFDVLPDPEGHSHFRNLVQHGPPDIHVERDIGAPPAFINELVEHVRIEMTDPDLRRRFRLPRAATLLLSGVSGSGKTLSIQGFWRKMYEVMSELTRTPIDELPPRVMKLRMPQILSQWLGESDKRLDRFFDECEELADELFVAPDGNEYELPVLVICEEVDGLARTRGGDPIYDRIQTTFLERLDLTSQAIRDKLIIFLFTTNVPDLVDPAALRRAGGTTVRFGRLDDKSSFLAVLHKHLDGQPLHTENGTRSADACRGLAAKVSASLFSPNGQDTGQVELTYVGSTQPVVKYRRDFLTGALIDRACQQAAREACRAESEGSGQQGITASMLMYAFDNQVRSIVEQLTPANVVNYTELPDGVRVATVRRIPQQPVTAAELVRVA